MLTTFSKLYERVFYNRLANFLKLQKILFEFQFGFRTNHSTDMALTVLMDKIIDALEKGHLMVGIFLDFSKAFDTVNHQILLAKLSLYGIRGVPNNWIKSYLSERTQFCTYDNVKSSTKQINCGVPQGSILGPLLFLTYINDLHSATTHSDIILFADDSNMFSQAKSINQIQDNLNTEIPKLVTWLQANRLSLNIDKTHAMIFGTRNKEIKNSFNIAIEGKPLQTVTKTKFLGVIIDDQFNWKHHIAYTAKKVAKAIGIISIARKVFNKATLVNLYYAFVYPYLIYGNIVWGRAGKTIVWPLYRLQKIIIRMISNVKYRTRLSPYFTNLKILKLEEIHILTTGIFMYKFKNQLLPAIFNNFFNENREFHSYPTRGANKLRAPKLKSKVAQNFVKKTGADLWNLLEPSININLGLNTFKKHLKVHILSAQLTP